MKHAYLIMAHNEFEILRTLLRMLDDVRNDIYLHIDKKIEVKASFVASVNEICTKSKLRILDNRIDVRWGTLSLIEAELALFSESFNGGEKYGYFHLISGVDLPIKNQDYIHDFFEQNKGMEFVEFRADSLLPKFKERVELIHLLPSKFGSKSLFYPIVRKIFKSILKIFRYKRWKSGDGVLKYGSNWLSITSDLVEQILGQEQFIRDKYKYSYIGDELFVQTLVYNSEYMSRCSEKGAVREIDWERGNPYVWRFSDLELLKESENLFARKFSSKDMKLVNAIYKLYK